MSKSISNFFINKDLDNNNSIVMCLSFSKQIHSKINELAKTITKLDLSCCKINGTKLINLLEILGNFEKLQTLKLNLNSINIDEAIAIVTVIINCSNLKELDFSNNNIILDKNSDKTILLINKLKECPSLINLNLSCNSIAKENIMEFEKNLPDCIVNWTYY
jgi:hypothetical protein